MKILRNKDIEEALEHIDNIHEAICSRNDVALLICLEDTARLTYIIGGMKALEERIKALEERIGRGVVRHDKK